jgi:sterol desaturase/sphingolipid hydroxylase (fatty acid hydroxylase superfamily)
MSSLVAAALGAFLWTGVEYLLHRFAFHEKPVAALGASEHQRHHVEVDYFAPTWQKALAAGAVTGLLWPLAWLASDALSATAFTTGFVAMYVSYEVLHRRAHTHPPRGPYGRWLRRNHFAHHFRDPRRAYGVTSPVWDLVFGTRLPAAPVRVPRRLAMVWLLDESGEIPASLARDYVLVGPSTDRKS